MAKGLFLLVLFVGLMALTIGGPLEDYQTIMGVRIYDLDPTCAMLGGLCVMSNDCLEQPTKSGLCPSNRNIGVECCYELAVKQGTCRSYGGECVTHKCNPRLQVKANDCGPGQMCCVLV